jgi:oligopeptide/dipeptide ABC transporter ATP-binding protein
MNGDPLVLVQGARRWFRTPAGMVRAVDGVNLEIRAGERVALVGETGSGKTTLGRMIAGLDTPTNGAVFFEGRPIQQYRRSHLQALRRRIGVVFQDPFSSLNPRISVRRIIEEPLAVHRWRSRLDRHKRVVELMDAVGLEPSLADARPSALSGGQRQRVAIARSIALKPDLLVLDEPVSSLDVSVQAQVLNLVQSLYEEIGFAALVISHDLAVVRQIVDRVIVMYLGKVMESGSVDAVFSAPQHPYAIALLSSAMGLDDRERAMRILLPGDPPSSMNPPTGCRFHPRCFRMQATCTDVEPLLQVRNGISVACHYPGPLGSYQNDARAKKAQHSRDRAPIHGKVE